MKVEGLVEVEGAELKIQGGDSGGPFFFVEANKEVLMEGLTVAKITEKRGWYEPLHTVLNTLNLDLLTKNNENRTKDKEQKEKEEKGGGSEHTKILPEPTTSSPLKSSGKGGEDKLVTVGGTEAKCKSSTSTSEFTSANLGTFHYLFSECKGPLGSTCTGEGDSKGSVALLGTSHYWLALLSEKLVSALVFLFNETHFTCEVLGTKELVIVKGCAAALAEPTEKLTKVTKAVFNQEKGVNDIKEVLPQESTKEIKCTTETSVNGGKFEESAQAATDENEKLEQGGKAIEVLLMS